MNFFFYASVAGALLILVRSLWEKDRYQDVVVATFLVAFSLFMSFPERLTVYLHPQTLDLTFYQIDKWFHLDALATCLWVQRSFPNFTTLLEVVYYALPLMMALAYAAERNLMVPHTAIIAGIAAYPFYNLYPATGPLHLFLPSGIASLPAGPRNCMPSLHFSWALLVAINCQKTWLRAIAWTFFVLTAMSTIVSGEHYFIDLFAAVPFCYGVQVLSRVKERRALTRKIQPA